MGNIVVGEALKKYSGNPRIHTYIATQAALSSHYYDQTIDAPVPQWIFPISTPNIIGHFSSGNDLTPPCFWFNQLKVRSGGMFNYYNPEDYALTDTRWELNNVLKPDDIGPYYFGYDGSEDHYSETGENRDMFSRGILSDPNLEKLSVTNDIQRYRIFSYCAESRVKALGTQVLSGGFNGNCRNLENSTFKFDKTHYSHSLQFRSNIAGMKSYWEQVFIDCGFMR